MCNRLTSKLLPYIDVECRAQEIPSRFDQLKLPFHAIDCINWYDFPDFPDVKFRLARNQQGWLLHYKVRETWSLAVFDSDNDPVWNDSCVECFVAPANDNLYYNLEINCIGTLLLGVGENRHQRERADANLIKRIDRWSSLGRTPFSEAKHIDTWEVAVVFPYDCFFRHRPEQLHSTEVRANFYKCGNALPRPHYLSWQPVVSERPDFHRPECFGRLSIR